MVDTEANEWRCDMATMTIHDEKSSCSAGFGVGPGFENCPNPVLTNCVTCPTFSIR